MDNKDLYNKDMGNNLLNKLKDSSLCLYNNMGNNRLIFNNHRIQLLRVNLNQINKVNQFKEYRLNNDFYIILSKIIYFFLLFLLFKLII